MSALDKIYLLKVELEERWPGITEASELEPEKEECYIRKDALLEWAKKEMGKWSSESNTAQGVKMGITLVLDKIESL